MTAPPRLCWRPRRIEDRHFGASHSRAAARAGHPYELHFDKVPLGQTITKVVLMAPCSVTHHSDMHQRYIELRVDVVEDGHQVKFSCTQGETVVPRGIYMLFVVTNTSVSHAIWVMFQS